MSEADVLKTNDEAVKDKRSCCCPDVQSCGFSRPKDSYETNDQPQEHQGVNADELLWIGPFIQFRFTIVPLINVGIILIAVFGWHMCKITQ